MASAEPLRHLPILELGAPGLNRADHDVIARMVRNGAKVLDVGCADGALLNLLARERGVKGRGMELSQAGVNACVSKGLSVVQGDADRDLKHFPNCGFDYAILSNTIQAVRRPRAVLKELARIGERVVVSFANFGHWRVRTQLLAGGRMPVTGNPPARWWETDNFHLCTVRDFAELAEDLHLNIERAIPLTRGQPGAPFAKNIWHANWFAEEAVFLLAQN